MFQGPQPHLKTRIAKHSVQYKDTKPSQLVSQDSSYSEQKEFILPFVTKAQKSSETSDINPPHFNVAQLTCNFAQLLTFTGWLSNNP